MRCSLSFLALAFAVLLAACSGGEVADTTSSSATPTTTTTVASSTTDAPPVSSTLPVETTTTPSTTVAPTTIVAPTTTEDPTSNVTVVAIEVADGEVVEGEEVVEIARDSEVEVIVTADISDEVHLHGYNVFADVAPGAPASIMFVATIPGIFEVELEGFGLLLVELEIS